ncbi:MAG: hypothetical protein Q7J76_12055, partial [Candidatus Brocadiaceae bacterium]|nr:hypothetical protein [Candidatus Brocadiaceae bacterium]
TGEDGCPVEGETITANIAPSGKRFISILSTSRNTDANGEATFTITAKKKTGKARITFQAAGQTKTILVTVKK